jgi:hypothetical protein
MAGCPQCTHLSLRIRFHVHRQTVTCVICTPLAG